MCLCCYFRLAFAYVQCTLYIYWSFIQFPCSFVADFDGYFAPYHHFHHRTWNLFLLYLIRTRMYNYIIECFRLYIIAFSSCKYCAIISVPFCRHFLMFLYSLLHFIVKKTPPCKLPHVVYMLNIVLSLYMKSTCLLMMLGIFRVDTHPLSI